MTAPAPAGRYADGVYDTNAPGMQQYRAANALSYREQQLVDQAMQSQVLPSYALRQLEPAVPPRFGYRTDEPGIADVVHVDRRYPDSSAAWSGGSGAINSSGGPSLGWW